MILKTTYSIWTKLQKTRIVAFNEQLGWYMFLGLGYTGSRSHSDFDNVQWEIDHEIENNI